MITLQQILLFLVLSLPASIISTWIANKAMEQEADLKETIVETLIRLISFWIIFIIISFLYNYAIGGILLPWS